MSATQQALGEAIAEKIFSQDKSLHMLPYYVRYVPVVIRLEHC